MGKIKRAIFERFFKDEIRELRDDFAIQLERYENTLRHDYQKKEKKISEVTEAAKLALKDGCEIVAIECNKHDKEVVVARWLSGSDIWMELYGKGYMACNRHPRIMSTYRRAFAELPSYIWIDDILEIDTNVGNGSILMREFLKFVKTTDAHYISGELSSKDADHFDRSEHFYKKHGFVVTFNDERSAGAIRYDLKDKDGHPIEEK